MRRRLYFGKGFAQKRSEKTVMIAIIRWLCFQPNTFAWCMETTGMYVRFATGFEKLLPSLSKGKPDIAGFKGDKGFVMEVKLDGKGLDPDQKEWREIFIGHTGAAHRYFIVRSVYEAEAAWESI